MIDIQKRQLGLLIRSYRFMDPRPIKIGILIEEG